MNIPEPLVSIIIPTYNRAQLIGETLDSVLAQTYTHWECIIVDDGSNDTTDGLVGSYVQKDGRFQYYHRPKDRPKGANACRNYGIEKMKGEFVVFFDSDDLMVENHVEYKLRGIQEHHCDFVITKTEYFNIAKSCNYNYLPLQKNAITAYNYIVQKINWLTLDVCIRAEVLNDIRFNEKLKSGQEYNFFSKLVLKTTKAKFFSITLSLRRFHENSIRSLLRDERSINESAFQAIWHTYLDVKQYNETPINRELLKKCVTRIYSEKRILSDSKTAFLYAVYKEFSLSKFFWFLLLLCSLKIFKKGYYFRSKFVA